MGGAEEAEWREEKETGGTCGVMVSALNENVRQFMGVE